MTAARHTPEIHRMTDAQVLETIRVYFEEAELYAGAGLLRFVSKVGAGYVVVLASRGDAPAREEWDEDVDDPATVVELSEESVEAAERVLSALRRDHPELRELRISLAFDNPQAPDVFPGDFDPR